MNKEETLKRVHRIMTATGYSDSTHKSYHKWIARLFDHLYPVDSKDITLSDAQDYLLYLYEEKNPADGTYNQCVDALRYFFATIQGIQYEGKQLSKRRIKVVQKNPIMPDQARLLVNECKDPMLKAAIALAFGCGLRISEVANLKVKNVHRGSQTITVEDSKGNKTRTVNYSLSVGDIVNDYLKIGIRKQGAYLEEEDYIFRKYKKPGDKLSTSAIRVKFNQYLQTFDFHLPDQTFHGLRHAFATGLAEKNVSLLVIQKLMGHSSIATTAKYIHVPDKTITTLPDLLKGDD